MAKLRKSEHPGLIFLIFDMYKNLYNCAWRAVLGYFWALKSTENPKMTTTPTFSAPHREWSDVTPMRHNGRRGFYKMTFLHNPLRPPSKTIGSINLRKCGEGMDVFLFTPNIQLSPHFFENVQ